MTLSGDTMDVLHVDADPELVDVVATFLTRDNERFRFETAMKPAKGWSDSPRPSSTVS